MNVANLRTDRLSLFQRRNPATILARSSSSQRWQARRRRRAAGSACLAERAHSGLLVRACSQGQTRRWR